MKYKVTYKVGEDIEVTNVEVDSKDDVKLDFRFINFGNKLFINYDNFIAFEEIQK